MWTPPLTLAKKWPSILQIITVFCVFCLNFFKCYAMNPKFWCMHLNKPRFFFSVALVRAYLIQLTFLETPTIDGTFTLFYCTEQKLLTDHLRLISQERVRRAGWLVLVSFWKVWTVCWIGGEGCARGSSIALSCRKKELSRTVLVLQGCTEVTDCWPAGVKSTKPNLGSSCGDTLVILLVKLPLYILY